jgi:hypothetical protein
MFVVKNIYKFFFQTIIHENENAQDSLQVYWQEFQTRKLKINGF